MPNINEINAGGELVKCVAAEINKERAQQLKSLYGGSGTDKIFANADLLATCFCLFENDLNVSMTASKLYMHRNTLIYRINKIEKECGLNLCKFSDAVTFLLLYALERRGKK